MPADLQPVFILADVVGVVDGPGRQPPQPLVEDFQRFDVGGDGLQHGRGLDQRSAGEKRRALTIVSTSTIFAPPLPHGPARAAREPANELALVAGAPAVVAGAARNGGEFQKLHRPAWSTDGSS